MLSTRHLFTLVVTIALFSCQPAEEEAVTEEASAEQAPTDLDPVSVDPDHYKVELENDYVRVIRGTFKAGEETPTHEDALGVAVFLDAGSADVTPPDGETETMSWEGGSVEWSELARHSAVAKTDFEYVTVDLKGEGGEPIPIDENDATMVDSEHHVVELENDRVRVVRMTYVAGETTPKHVHLPGVNILLTGGKALNHVEGEEAQEVELSEGNVAWSEGTPLHATENTGDEDFVIVRVEMKQEPAM